VVVRAAPSTATSRVDFPRLALEALLVSVGPSRSVLQKRHQVAVSPELGTLLTYSDACVVVPPGRFLLNRMFFFAVSPFTPSPNVWPS